MLFWQLGTCPRSSGKALSYPGCEWCVSMQTQACAICSTPVWQSKSFTTRLNTKHALTDNYSLTTEIVPSKTQEWMRWKCHCELSDRAFQHHLVKRPFRYPRPGWEVLHFPFYKTWPLLQPPVLNSIFTCISQGLLSSLLFPLQREEIINCLLIPRSLVGRSLTQISSHHLQLRQERGTCSLSSVSPW